MLLVAAMMAAAKRHLPRTDVRTWCMPSLSAIADTTRFADTTMLNYHDIDIQQRYSLSSTTNGNVLVSPIESRIINDRVRTIDDPFAWSLAPYVVTPQQQRYFNTKTPYSAVAYKKGFVSGHPENDLSVLFTGNLNRRTNLGLEMEYLSSLGHYQHTEGKLFRGTVWGSYDGPHYSMHGTFSWSKLSSFDNGGLKDINDMTSSLGSNDLPVRMQAMTDYRYLSGYLHNQYTLTKDREYHDTIEVVESGQTLQKDTVKVKHTPMMTFSHIIDINNYSVFIDFDYFLFRSLFLIRNFFRSLFLIRSLLISRSFLIGSFFLIRCLLISRSLFVYSNFFLRISFLVNRCFFIRNDFFRRRLRVGCIDLSRQCNLRN